MRRVCRFVVESVTYDDEDGTMVFLRVRDPEDARHFAGLYLQETLIELPEPRPAPVYEVGRIAGDARAEE